jgi:hypothetical protein
MAQHVGHATFAYLVEEACEKGAAHGGIVGKIQRLVQLGLSGAEKGDELEQVNAPGALG